VITGWSDPEIVARARRSGFFELLVKPVDLDTLERLLARTPWRRGPGADGSGPR
jgi:response regulator of citrate/malate metabolism